MVKIIGHRGSRDEYPENTILGIKKAIENNVDGVEIDVHLSKDSELIVIHDDSVDRTTDSFGNIIDMTLPEIKKLDAGNGEQVPILQEVIGVIKEANVELFIEIKCPGAKEKVVEAISCNSIYSLAVVKSFDHRIVKKVKELDDNIKTACLIVGLPVHAYKIIEDACADMISINANTVDESLISECHEHNKKVFVWNIDNKEELARFISMGADYIGTNLPSKINL